MATYRTAYAILHLEFQAHGVIGHNIQAVSQCPDGARDFAITFGLSLNHENWIGANTEGTEYVFALRDPQGLDMIVVVPCMEV